MYGADRDMKRHGSATPLHEERRGCRADRHTHHRQPPRREPEAAERETLDKASNHIIAGPDADFQARNEENSPGYELDEDQLAMLEELRTPLEKVWTDEFERYAELFYKYLPKRPFHVRRRYGDGFICAKGKYKKTGEAYDRTCCPALIGKHLDYSRWKDVRGDRDHPPNYWIAMNAGKKSAVKALDIDNKENLLGYYRDGQMRRQPDPTVADPAAGASPGGQADLRRLPRTRLVHQFGNPGAARMAEVPPAPDHRRHPRAGPTKIEGDRARRHRDPSDVRSVFPPPVRPGLLHRHREWDAGELGPATGLLREGRRAAGLRQRSTRRCGRCCSRNGAATGEAWK